jgi:FAD/FMN-containing dehydrogenase
MVLGGPEFRAIMQVLDAFQKGLDLTAFEFFSDRAVQLVTARGDVPRPFDTAAPYYALLEFEATTPEVSDAALALFEACVEQGWVLDGVISQSDTQLRNLWRLREDISETISVFTPYKNDISVVVSKVPGFLEDIDAIVSKEYPDFEIIWFGHIGDGNLHLNILKPESLDKQAFFKECARVNQWVFETVQKYDGSISAEHGVGMTKKDYLHYTRPAEEVAYMRLIKQAFDPNHVMNPGKIFD